MPVTLDVADGGIDEGETKRLVITPKDAAGSALSLSSLTVEIAHQAGTGTDGSYELSDATQDGDDYLISHTFDAAGFWSVDVVGEDAEGNTERTSTRNEPVYVNPKPS